MSDDDEYDSYWDRYLPESYEERRNMFLNEKDRFFRQKMDSYGWGSYL